MQNLLVELKDVMFEIMDGEYNPQDSSISAQIDLKSPLASVSLDKLHKALAYHLISSGMLAKETKEMIVALHKAISYPPTYGEEIEEVHKKIAFELAFHLPIVSLYSYPYNASILSSHELQIPQLPDDEEDNTEETEPEEMKIDLPHTIDPIMMNLNILAVECLHLQESLESFINLEEEDIYTNIKAFNLLLQRVMDVSKTALNVDFLLTLLKKNFLDPESYEYYQNLPVEDERDIV